MLMTASHWARAAPCHGPQVMRGGSWTRTKMTDVFPRWCRDTRPSSVGGLAAAVVVLLLVPACSGYRNRCVSRPLDLLPRSTEEEILLPLRDHRDHLYGWDYVDGSDCDLEHSNRRVVINDASLTFQTLIGGEWHTTWATELDNIDSICRFRWHTLNPADALDGMEIKLRHRRRGVGKMVNLQSVRAQCGEDLLDEAEAFLRQHTVRSLKGKEAS